MQTEPQLLAPMLAEWPGDMPDPEEFDAEDDSQEKLLPDDDDYEDNELIGEDEDDYLGEEE